MRAPSAIFSALCSARSARRWPLAPSSLFFPLPRLPIPFTPWWRCRGPTPSRLKRADGTGDQRLRERAPGVGGARGEGARRRGSARPRARGAGGTRGGVRDRRGGAAGGRRRSRGRGRSDLSRGGERPPGSTPSFQGRAAALAQGGTARPPGWLPSSRHDARARACPGRAPPGGYARRPGAGPVRKARQESRGVPHEVRDHAVGDADGGGARADRP